MGYTEDGGASWNTQTNPDPQDRTLVGVFFFDPDYGWAVGVNGVILHTTDGGNKLEHCWGRTYDRRSKLCSFHTSPTNGYVVGNGKTLLKYGELTGTHEVNRNIAV